MSRTSLGIYPISLRPFISVVLVWLRQRRAIRAIAVRLLSLLLVASLFVSSTPASPKTLLDVAVSTKADLTLWFQVNGIIPRSERVNDFETTGRSNLV